MPLRTSRRLFANFRNEPLIKPKSISSKSSGSARNTVRAYLALLRPYRAAFVKIFVAAIAAEIIYLAVPMTTRLIIDGVLLRSDYSAETKLSVLIKIGLALAAMLIAAQALDFWRRFYTVLVNGRFVRALRLRLFTHLLRIPLSDIHEIKTGGIVSRLTSDAENLTGLLQMAVISPAVAFLRILITLVILVYWHLPLAIVAAGFIPPLVYISLVYILRVRPVYRSISNDRAQQDARTTEVFTGIRAVKAFGMQKGEAARYNLTQALMLRKNIFASLRESAIDGVWNFLLPVTSLLVMVIGGVFFLRHETTIGDLVAFQMYAGMLLYPVWRMVFSLSQIQKSLASLERVLDMLELQQEKSIQGGISPTGFDRIRFENVSFAYRTGQWVLKNISFDMQASRIYAIVGESGIGKSTAIDLLMRFYKPNTGQIACNERNVEEFDLAQYREQIAIVTQETILFDGTVRENLFSAAHPPSENEIRRILSASDAAGFIQELPQGLDTVIGERGFKLSGGQKQRLALARALARRASVLVLDEATAHLDTISEQKIRVHLDALKKRRIVILITHRLSTVRHADRILVFSRGRIEAQGAHAYLMRNSPTYKKLWQAQ